jgi:hypothetical protein
MMKKHVVRLIQALVIAACILPSQFVVAAEIIGVLTLNAKEQFKVSRCGKTKSNYALTLTLRESGQWDYAIASEGVNLQNYGTYDGGMTVRKIDLLVSAENQGDLIDAMEYLAGDLCDGSSVAITSYQPFVYKVKFNKRLDKAVVSLKSAMQGYNYSYGRNGKGSFTVKAKGSYVLQAID